MSQTQKPTKLGYEGIAARMAASGDGASCVKSIVGLTGACTASESSSFAAPAGATKLAANGFALEDCDSVGVEDSGAGIDDTVVANHIFECSGTQSVSGFAIENDADNLVFMECCFNVALAMENGDTLTLEAKMQFKLGVA